MSAIQNRLTVAALATVSFAALAGCGAGVESLGQSGSAQGATSAALSGNSPQGVPAAIAVPGGNKLDFFLDATGVQIYACKANATGFGWVFQAPQANLTDPQDGELKGTHFAGPTWQSVDGSSVVGSKVAAATVDPSSIPWLLLKAVSHQGQGKMDSVTYVQRLYTSGGLAPSAGCSASSAGATANVNYVATYYFYEAE
jgi:hypothetical protein